MKLGFLTAILPDLPLADVLAFASDEGFQCLEVMCWPPGKAERRYAGVTHIDVIDFNEEKAGPIRDLSEKNGVEISVLGYYPNILHPDADHRRNVIEHLKKVIIAAPMLNVRVVSTFLGRDPVKSVEDNWPLFCEIWPGIIAHAEEHGINVSIENCPMIFSLNEWPGGTNLAATPAIWHAMFQQIPSPHFGLTFDPSHLIWQHIDYLRAIREFAPKIHHVHAKDTRIDPNELYARGVMGLGWHTPKIPGLGDVDWGQFISVLGDSGYKGPVCVEVEDRAFEDTLEDRKRSLRQSRKHLDQFFS